MPIRKLWLTCCLLLWSAVSFASHNLAGQITYTKLAGANTFEILLTTYTDPTAAGVDRCTADIEIWGVANGQQVLIDIIRDVPRENGPNGNCNAPSRMGVFVRPTIKRNYYRINSYTFPGPGVYQLRYFDVARINNVSNISNSGSVAFYVETQLVISPFIGTNNSVQLLNDPLDDACLNRLWTHNPGAFDPDGDSLVFRLIPCQQYDPSRDINSPINVPNYRFPSDFGGMFTIDATTGLITWDAATRVGIYNISFVVEEYRSGRLISYVIRDMAIFVKPCINRPPVIEVLRDTCVKPNSALLFTATLSDPDLNDSIYFYLNNAGQGANGPFNLVNSPATLDPPLSAFPIRATQIDPITALFTWNVNCGHIRSQHYQVDWYAHDNLIRFGNEPTLSDNEVTKIRVIPPSVDSLWAESGSRLINLRWSPNSCTNAIGYEIYRSSSGGGAPLDSTCCIGGGLGADWELVGKTSAWGDTTFTDDNDGQGLDFRGQYCYRIVSVFLGQPGQGLNSTSIVKSCPSPEVCIQIQRDFPILLHADVRITDAAAGQMFVSWARPDTSRISSFFPRPFTYNLQQATGIQGAVFSSLTPTPLAFGDTTLIVNALNTESTGYRYQVQLLDAGGDLVTSSDLGSSVYLATTPADRAVILNWQEFVPWRNFQYVIYRADPPSNNVFVAIDSLPGNGASSHTYTDRSLTVGQRYCYYVEAIGSYNVPGLPDSLRNNSNRACEIPVDLVPPCTPPKDSVTVSSNCETFRIRFFWPQPDTACASDLAFYTLYFTRTAGGNASPLAQIPLGTTEYLLDNSGAANIAGCYSLTATDTSGNESAPNEAVCLDNCPVIIIPPVFVPGGGSGGIRPILLRNIRSLRFVVFDRWGVEVSTSTDPNNLWDGTRNGNICPEGVYYYLIEIVLDDLNFTEVSRTGSITLLR